MKKNKPINMATGGLMSQPPYIAKNDPNQDSGITPYDVNTPQSARQGMPSRLLSPTRTRFKDGGESFPDLSGDGEVTQKDILIGKGVIKKAKGGLMKRMKFDDGQLSTREIIEMKKMEQLEAMRDSGLPLTDEQEKKLEEYKAAKAVKPAMALGGMIGVERSKYEQRPDYQAYSKGGLTDYQLVQLKNMGYDVKKFGIEHYGGSNVLKDILKVNKYAEGDIVEDENMAEAETDMEMMAEEDQGLLEPLGMNKEPMDEEMEDEDMGDMDAIIDTSALSEEEEKILDDAVEMHPELEAIIPKIVATEFTDDGEVEGPGTGTSDSIPALLSDGEFVFTAKAVKHLGVDKLRKMMKQAEEAYDAGVQSQAEQQEIV